MRLRNHLLQGSGNLLLGDIDKAYQFTSIFNTILNIVSSEINMLFKINV